MFYSLKNFKDLHMFFKELACFILFSYQCSFAVLINFVCVSFVRLTYLTNIVNNFFYFFQILFSRLKQNLTFVKILKRRKRDLNPRAAINDLLPFQGSPFSHLGTSPSELNVLQYEFVTNGEGGIRTHGPFRNH